MGKTEQAASQADVSKGAMSQEFPTANNKGGGEISITLASPDETAKVRIAVSNPDLVAEKVVTQLAKNFPPESVMTIAANGDGTTESTDTTSAPSPARKRNVASVPKVVEESEEFVDDSSSQYDSVSVDEKRPPPVGRYRRRDFAGKRPMRKDLIGPASKSQQYFYPKQLDYAIPVSPLQSSVKLVNGSRLRIDNHRMFTVEYDQRGLPQQTLNSEGRVLVPDWASNEPGVGIKYQDYFLDDDLVYAVPIIPGQSHVSLSDGGFLPVKPESLVTVFYDNLGRPAFSYNGARNRIRPGVQMGPGIAEVIKYYLLLNCNDGTGEQYAIPISDALAEEVPHPEKPNKRIPIDRRNITVVFYDESRTPLYSQLPDGSLISGGLMARDEDDDATTAESEFLSSESFRISPHRYNKMAASMAPRSSSRPPRNKQSVALESNVSTGGSKRQEIIERRVPVQQVQYVEKIVEVPEVHFVEKHVEVEKIEYETKIVKKKQVIERPVEHIKYVPKIETKIIERIIEVPKIIEVPRKEIIERKIPVDRFVDTKKEVVVSNELIPTVRDVPELIEDVECLRVEPELIPVDVYVPKLVRNKLLPIGKGEERRSEVDVSLSHYNSLVLRMNEQFSSNYDKLPLLKTNRGSFPLLPKDAKITATDPTDEEILALLQSTGLVSSELTSGPLHVRVKD